ncbi:SpoIIE family protein phosphatase [Streptomyces sp. NPDC056500]|uniref:SpoIIE family protein phosphatase n=1 Tax=Streptomyces sp. NPDC056500 TaxID=3345840 RepID=UPI0036B6B042
MPSGQGDEGFPPLLSLALTGILDDVRAQSGGLYLLSSNGQILEMVAKEGLPRDFSAPWERIPLSSPVPVAVAVREQQLVWVSGEEEMARRYPRIALVLPYPYCLAALPIAVAGTIYGAVYLTWPMSHARELAPAEREQLVAACDLLALNLQRAAEQGSPILPEAFLPDTDTPAVSAPQVEAIRTLARLPDGICSLDVHGRITYANPAAADLLGTPASGLVGQHLWGALPWVDDPLFEDRYRAAMLSQRETSLTALRPPRTWLAFRLYPGRGGITLRITPATREPVRTVAAGDSAAPSVRLVTISHILSLASALTEAVGVEEVIELVADEIMPAVGSSALAMLAAENGRLRVLGQRGYQDRHLVDRFNGTPLTARIPGTQTLATGIPSFFASRAELERAYPARHATPDGMSAWAYLPLIASGRPVGTCVLGYAEEHRFSPHERAVLTSLGGLIAQALERAMLYDAKHRLAHGLQAALLPRSLPALDGLEAASRYLPITQGMDIGGDFFDLVPTDGKAAAVIGDVQGHDVTAAGLMGQVRTAVRAYTAVGQPPGKVLESTNRLLIELEGELLASCIYVHLELEEQRAHIARAGHPPPLLREPDGRVRLLELAGGPLLGVDPAGTYPVTTIPLYPGSVLALYTDGLVELPGIDVDTALAALAERLSRGGGDSLETLARDLTGPVGSTGERADDTTLLLLRPLY